MYDSDEEPDYNYPHFPSPLHVPSDLKINTLVELRIRTLAGEILEKPNWWDKVHNDEIVSKWRREFVEQDAELVKKFWPANEGKSMEVPGSGGMIRKVIAIPDLPKRKLWPRNNITNVQLDYLFEWLRWSADTRDTKYGIQAMHISNIYQSYSLVPPELTDALREGASILESVPDTDKDWHPGSNNQVLDLVHPSLFCFRIGKSLVKNPEANVLYVPTVGEYFEARRDDLHFNYIPGGSKRSSLSIQHQWLPTDFSVSESGEVECLSYINNLHPIKDKLLYSTITSILERFVPLLEQVLVNVRQLQEPIIKVDPFTWYTTGPKRATPEPREEDFPVRNSHGRRNYRSDFYTAYDAWDAKNDPFVPEPSPFTPPKEVSFSLKGQTIQVIVKMANIILTPDRPEYPGGSWHVEGMDNERIVATGIYYYDCSNVTESKLNFRKPLSQYRGMKYQQDDRKGYLRVYGIDGNGGPLNQELGHIVTKEGKCLAFPNIWQHLVSPFKLADPSKPGHRKILCFFLVDPTVSILSTSVVPPQQYDWLREFEHASVMKNLPRELFDMITDLLKPDDSGNGGAITLEQAKEERAKLMEERSNFVTAQNEDVYEQSFNMCEH